MRLELRHCCALGGGAGRAYAATRSGAGKGCARGQLNDRDSSGSEARRMADGVRERWDCRRAMRGTTRMVLVASLGKTGVAHWPALASLPSPPCCTTCQRPLHQLHARCRLGSSQAARPPAHDRPHATARSVWIRSQHLQTRMGVIF